jgi:hypothetical protein
MEFLGILPLDDELSTDSAKLPNRCIVEPWHP